MVKLAKPIRMLVLAAVAVAGGCILLGQTTCRDTSSSPAAGAHSPHSGRESRMSESEEAGLPAREAPPGTGETATFGAGCFWGVEAAFRKVAGVTDTAVGYSGGSFANPTYEDVCSGRTGHAEVVRVTFDPGRASYEQLMEVFWSCHDPTTPNRQGPDVGTQYRSAIFFHSPAQEAAARTSKAAQEASGRFPGRIVTEITPAAAFYRAEEYHQRYLEKRGDASCGTAPSD